MRRPRFKASPGRSRYGRNRFGGVVWRRDDRAHAQTPTAVTTEDNYYLYDGTNQIKERKRGNLLAGTPPNYTGIDPIQQQENWTYDAAGNWTQYSNPSTAAGHTQVREHNDGNELWKISVSGLGEVWPIYDSMGNMRTLPKAPGVSTDHYTLKWDAWNRLVEVKDGSTVVASYTYDGLNRRLTKTAGSEIRHYYYDTQWRPVEERIGSSTTPDRQYTWGLRDRWDLIRRKRSTTNPLDETLYVLRDYLDPVAIADAAGNVVERYAYDAFGNVRFLDQNYGSRSNSSYAWDYLVEGAGYYYETLLDYLHLNPVRAGLVDLRRGQSVRDYAWSSVAGGHALPPRRRPPWLATAEVLAAFGCADTPAGRKRWVQRLDDRAHAEAPLPSDRRANCSQISLRYTPAMITVAEVEKLAFDLPDAPRAVLAAHLLRSLPSVLHEDEGMAEALRRDAECDANPEVGITVEQFDQQIGSCRR
jgi:YD repeat-containing protein